MQTFADCLGQMLFFHGQRRFIQIFDTSRFCSTFSFGTLQNREILSLMPFSRGSSVRHTMISGWIPMLCKALTEVWVGFGLHLSGSLQIGDQRHMDQDRVFAACFMLELADGLQERLALDIAYRAADPR